MEWSDVTLHIDFSESVTAAGMASAATAVIRPIAFHKLSECVENAAAENRIQRFRRQFSATLLAERHIPAILW